MGELVAVSFPRGSGAVPSPWPKGFVSGNPTSEMGLPWPERRRRWWLLWAGCPGLGIRRLEGLEQRFGSLEEAWKAPAADLAAVQGLGAGLRAAVEAYRQRHGADPVAAGKPAPAAMCRVLLPGDPANPRAFTALERPPLAIYWQGQGALWPVLRRREAVAVVGTRNPSLHGLAMAEAVGAALAAAGWPVVSGLADGIDAAAHRGCLAQDGKPVAVLGTPLRRAYPRHHGPLQQFVAARGLLITEQPPGASVQRGHFAARNRLQVALAKAVVVIECPFKSGALHSAALAWEQGLPLWVVPADAAKVSAQGSNRLLLQGATPLLQPGDLVHQLGPGPLLQAQSSAERATGLPSCRAGALTFVQRNLLAALGSGASLEHLCQSLGEPPAHLSSLLLDLELAGLISAEPGLYWRPAHGSFA